MPGVDVPRVVSGDESGELRGKMPENLEVSKENLRKNQNVDSYALAGEFKFRV